MVGLQDLKEELLCGLYNLLWIVPLNGSGTANSSAGQRSRRNLVTSVNV